MAPAPSQLPAFVLILAGTLAPARAVAAAPEPGAQAAPDRFLQALPGHWRDDQGRDLDLHALAGQRLVVTMAYASCHRTCPLTIQRLERLQKQLDAAGSSATFIVVGYDPANDDPATWRQYRRERRLGRANWLFLTAPGEAQVRQFARLTGFGFWKYDEHVMHEERVIVIGPQGDLQQAWGPGEPFDAAALIATPATNGPRGS